MVVSGFEPGSFCWDELETPDSAGAKKFYGELFGWTYEDHNMGEGMVYTMLQLNGNTVGALYQGSKPGIPPHWTTYISTNSADESASKAGSLGGNIIAQPFDVMDVGRMAVIQDPQGAVFCIWQKKMHAGSGVVDEPNAFCWHELNTSDPAGAKSFYTGVFGWETKGDETQYTEWINGGKSIGGMMKITEQMGPVPPHWLAYIQVTACDDTVEKAKSLGATALMPGMDIPDVGRFAVIKDPQGAVFAIVQLARRG